MKTNKKVLGFILSCVLFLGLIPVSTHASEIDNPEQIDLNQIQRDLQETNIDINTELGLVIVSEKVSDNNSEKNSSDTQYTKTELSNVSFSEELTDELSIPEKQATATFAHNIYSSNGSLLATAYSTVTGWYSSLDNWSSISDISVRFTGSSASKFSATTSKNGNIGYAYISYNGVSAATFKYRITTNGNIYND